METETKAPTCVCEDCKKEIPIEKAVSCEICNREDDNVENDAVKCKYLQKSNEPVLYCKRCTDTCFICEMVGCSKCVNTVCCDCGVSMCDECRSCDNICRCYGKCYTCRRNINRGSEGWPCDECGKWYCRDCRRGENPCKECGPEEESEEEDDTN